MSNDPEDPALRSTGKFDEQFNDAAIKRARELLTAMPENVGPYRILERIGGGGMGDVYRAEQRSPIRRQVAIKFIKPGMDSKTVLARFEVERQALALMDHPHIAKVFDAGTDETGRPYFVMEYVKGKPITEYADQNHLTIAERLELFEQVCQAIQHAHHKGVIHRDLKPGNVLVSTQDDEAIAKVIDFGIAKAISQKLTDETVFTQHDQFVGTPQYMSPEQASGSVDIDTRTDVYSLGVLLYELLTGSTPFSTNDIKAAAFEQLKKMIIEIDPPKPSTRLTPNTPTLTTLAAFRRIEPKRLGGLIQGELDWIVMKAIEKDRRRRYETPTSLAHDILAHLKGEPVKAAPPSTAYRIQKFVKKHRVPMIAGTMVVAALLIGFIGTTWGFLLERVARNEADLQQKSANIARDEAEKQRLLELIARQRAELNEELAKRHLYDIHMNLAQGAWNNNQAGETIRLLDLYRPLIEVESATVDLRGFEWFYLDRLCHDDLLTLQGHTDRVHCVTYSPDGQRLASGSADNTIKLWDAIAGTEVLTLKGHSDTVQSVAYSPDGHQLVSASDDKTLKVWNTTTGKELFTLNGHTERVTRCVYSPDGRRLATASHDKTIKIWDSASGAELMTLNGHKFWVTSIAYSPDGQQLASAGWNDSPKIWDATTGNELLTLKGHGLIVTYSPDGEQLASDGKGGIQVWNVASGEEVFAIKAVASGIGTLSYSSDGFHLASGSFDGVVDFWDAHNGQKLSTIKGHAGSVTSIVFSPDGQRLASASSDGTLKIWDATMSAEFPVLNRHMKAVVSVAYSPVGTRLATASYDNTVKVWDAPTGTELLTLSGHKDVVTSVVFSPDGRQLASASWDHSVKLWDALSGSELATLDGHMEHVTFVAYSPKG